MRPFRLSALALALETASAYLDTSPFFIFSTSEYVAHLAISEPELQLTSNPRLLSSSANVQTASSITESISRSLSQCRSDFYILVSQPGVTSSDYTSPKHTPTLARLLSSQSPQTYIRSSQAIPEVIGDIYTPQWAHLLSTTCHAKPIAIDASTGRIPTTFTHSQVISLSFNAPSTDPKARQDELHQNDAILASLLDMLPSTNFTVLYTTSTSAPITDRTKLDSELYESDILEAENFHIDLRRDLSGGQRLSRRQEKETNVTLPEGGLVHKYVFVGPGMFSTLS